MVTMQTHDINSDRAARTRPTWLAFLGAVLLLVLGFGAGFLTSQVNQSDPIGLADEATVKIVDDGIRAAEDGDVDGLAAIYTDDAVLMVVNRSGNTMGRFEGAREVAANAGPTTDLTRTSEVLQQGELVSYTYTELRSQGTILMRLKDGKIATQWVVIGGAP